MKRDNELSLSLISHTNAGKTTLVRTLLRRDVGTILDQAHVTEEPERFVMLELPADAGGGRIELWDTPGFGDSARLLRTLEQQEQPLDWLAAQHYDRNQQRPLWCSQQAILNVRDEAEVVLYLLNASEDPEMAGYVEPEMRILGWIGRPVIALLNQTGPPGDADGRRREEERWRWHLASHAAVRDVISLDAFNRCWVQEGLLLLRLQALVPEPRKPLMDAFLERWSTENHRAFTSSAARLAKLLAEAAADREPVGEAVITRLARRRAAESLAQRLDTATRRAVNALIELYDLEGAIASWARGQLADMSLPGDRPDPTRVGLMGGLAGGALGGLVADLHLGGLSLGGGTLAGAILGGLGLGALTWGYDQLGGESEQQVVWSAEFLERVARDAVLRYLAVAHYGRGSGSYAERVEPALWRDVVEGLVGRRSRELRRAFAVAREDGADAATARLAPLLDGCLRDALIELYPGTERFLRESD